MQDLLDYCDLEHGEIEAIAEHEHIPMAVAAEMSEVLLCSPEGVCQLHAMIIENMQHALDAGHYERVRQLAQTYQHLQRRHPIPGA
ncbi:MAG: hypothetical protein LWW83_03320 [Azonexaceae bacterium]|uniref:hypothetical protein n=1 Tax=Azonexus sp. R2A61 TaxID=2744443 RepID=UPI001F2DD19C|nr:hypothetical protein [Azonexus sp. R2A61]MCE1238942.1 hypothetical protein [Azonexaceae bacterium]